MGNAETQNLVNTIFNTATECRTIRARVTDSCGEISYGDFQIGMEWDEDNPETIGQEDEVVVSVKGGIGQFNESVSGTGFSMAVPVTDDRTNLLISDGSACGARKGVGPGGRVQLGDL